MSIQVSFVVFRFYLVLVLYLFLLFCSVLGGSWQA